MGLRKSLGLHAQELAAAMGVTRTRVTAIENQVHVSPPVVSKYRIGLRAATVKRADLYRRARSERPQTAMGARGRPEVEGTSS